MEECLISFHETSKRYPLVLPIALTPPGSKEVWPYYFRAALELGHRIRHPYAKPRFLTDQKNSKDDTLEYVWGEIIYIMLLGQRGTKTTTDTLGDAGHALRKLVEQATDKHELRLAFWLCVFLEEEMWDVMVFSSEVGIGGTGLGPLYEKVPFPSNDFLQWHFGEEGLHSFRAMAYLHDARQNPLEPIVVPKEFRGPATNSIHAFSLLRGAQQCHQQLQCRLANEHAPISRDALRSCQGELRRVIGMFQSISISTVRYYILDWEVTFLKMLVRYQLCPNLSSASDVGWLAALLDGSVKHSEGSVWEIQTKLLSSLLQSTN